jgi:hypothetical protein
MAAGLTWKQRSTTFRTVSPAFLYFTIVTSALGAGYIRYGKRPARFAPALCGLGLCGYTYFVDSWLWLCVIGVLLLVAPFVLDF